MGRKQATKLDLNTLEFCRQILVVREPWVQHCITLPSLFAYACPSFVRIDCGKIVCHVLVLARFWHSEGVRKKRKIKRFQKPKISASGNICSHESTRLAGSRKWLEPWADFSQHRIMLACACYTCSSFKVKSLRYVSLLKVGLYFAPGNLVFENLA